MFKFPVIWLKHTIVFTLGVLIGYVCNQSFRNSYQHVPLDSNIERQTLDDRIISKLEEQRLTLESFLRDEISTQLSSLNITVDRNINAPMDCQEARSGNPHDADKVKMNEYDPMYESANDVLENAISSGSFDQYSAAEFVKYLDTLPTNKQFELRVKQIDAFNRGLLESPLMPEEIVMQSQYE